MTGENSNRYEIGFANGFFHAAFGHLAMTLWSDE